MGGRFGAILLSLLAAACGEGSHKPKNFYADGGTGGTGGASGGGGAGGSGGSAGAGECAELSLNVEGDLDGAAVDGLLGAYRGYSEGDGSTRNWLAGGGIYMWNLPSVQDGDPIQGPAWLSAPVGLELAGAQLLADEASTTQGVSQPPIVFTGLHTLGNCPGTPVTGSIAIFEPEDSFASGSITGTLDGTSIDLTTDPVVETLFYIEFQGVGHVQIDFADHGNVIVVGAPGSMKGALIMPGSTAEADSVFCVGKATLSGDVFADKTLTLEELSRTDGKWPGTAVSGTLTTTFCQGP